MDAEREQRYAAMEAALRSGQDCYLEDTGVHIGMLHPEESDAMYQVHTRDHECMGHFHTLAQADRMAYSLAMAQQLETALRDALARHQQEHLRDQRN